MKSRWFSRSVPLTRTFQVKVKPARLEGFDGDDNDERKDKVVAIKMKWKKHESRSSLLHFHLNYAHGEDFTSPKMIKQGLAVEWDDEFENTCSFTAVANDDHKFKPWFLSFAVLYGENMESRAPKLAVIGKATLDMAEEVAAAAAASRMEGRVERKLPIKLQVDGVATDATLVVALRFAEMRDSPGAHDSTNSGELSNNSPGGAAEVRRLATDDESAAAATATSSSVEKKMGFFSWKRRRLSLRTDDVYSSVQKAAASGASSNLEYQNEDHSTTDTWESKELVSRDGKTKLKASVFFATFDQRSDKAAGESACAVLATVISHWLQSNRYTTPTTSEFDDLIVEGSAEWRKLCEIDANVSEFPNKHFDLDTVMRAHVRPLAISHDQSFIGFFGPEKFECLKGMSSFDEIWEKISRTAEDFEPNVYILSWNDHFFVLKVEANTYYIFDTLGERLLEGCKQAYILRFDESSAMMSGPGKNPEAAEADKIQGESEKGENKEMICSGKECCKEFIKRFLAAIPLKELEEEEEKKPVSYFSLHHRLQIEFNFCYLQSPSSSTSSPFSSSPSSTSLSDRREFEGHI